MGKGKVWLVGAGPSDIELLTIKAKRVIESADIIVYDRLVSFNTLNLRKNNSILVDVGKVKDNHTMPQDSINKLLMKYAKENKKVVRLKGGDPFLFGRGGEELEFLLQNDVECEVVCGITSALSVPAYAGIPVTHREFSSSVHIITGHKKDDESNDINYNALKNTGGTLIFLMGISRLNEICNGLLSVNMSPTTPVCIMERGTTSAQRNILGKLNDICEIATKEDVKSPAIIVVGDVCSLKDNMDWRTLLPLNNRRIIVTRPRDKNSILCQKLRDNGAEVIEIPTIKTISIINNNTDSILNNITKYNYIIFTSITSVNIFFEKIINLKIDIRSLHNIKFVAIGSGTKNSIENRGILVDVVPDVYNGECLSNKLLEIFNKDDNILIFSPEISEKSLENNLEKAGVTFDKCILYKTIYEDIDFVNFEILYTDIIIFTSTSTVKSFVYYMNNKNIDLNNITAICIGKTTENEAKKHNMNTYISDISTIDSLVNKVKEIVREV